MSNNRRNFLLLIKLRHGSFGLVLPVALFVVDDLLQSLCDLAALGQWLFPRGKLPGLIANHLLVSWRELRRLGRWQLLEVADSGFSISLSFY